jgi:predicted lipoprotein with Yx(FWY)xxD motif
MFTKDTPDTSNCYDQCEVAWPPLLTLDQPTLMDGVEASLLGATQRKDGTLQVTYNGLPLYYFAADRAPGDTNGQGVGSVWYVVTPDGKAVQ